MPLPLPPFTYNDPRIAYNEHCFLYNGGYDEVCLNLPEPQQPRRGGKSTNYRARSNRLDLLLTATLSGSNEPHHLRFVDGEDEVEPKVLVTEVRHDSSEPSIFAEIRQTKNPTPQAETLVLVKRQDVSVKGTLINKTKLTTTVSGSLGDR